MGNILGIHADDVMEKAIAVLQRGEVLAFPTETVYGIGVRYGDPAALARLRALKKREEKKPFQVLIADVTDLAQLGVEPSPQGKRLIHAFWPGPLTIVFPSSHGETIGVRLPDHPFLLSLLRAFGTPLVATSANRAGEPPASTAAEVFAIFNQEVGLVLDGGEIQGTPSTIAKIEDEQITILREGAIPSSAIHALAKDNAISFPYMPSRKEKGGQK